MGRNEKPKSGTASWILTNLGALHNTAIDSLGFPWAFHLGLNLRPTLYSPLSGALLCSEFQLSASVWRRRSIPGKTYLSCCRYLHFPLFSLSIYILQVDISS